MASEQLSEQVHYVAPKDLDYVGGEWRRPTDLCPTAELLSAVSFTASGKVVINQFTNHVVVKFEVSKTCDNYGLEGAGVHINIRFGKEGKVVPHSVQEQLDALKPNEKGLLHATFQWDETIGFKHLHFSFSGNVSKVPKRGLIFYQAIVEEFKDGSSQ